MFKELTEYEASVLQAAATIFASLHHEGKAKTKPGAKKARKYAITQAYLLTLAIEEMRNEPPVE